MSSLRQQINEIHEQIKVNLDETVLVLSDQASLFVILKYVIECLETHSEFKGEDKTYVAEKVLRKFVEEMQGLTIETRDMFFMMIDSGAVRETVHLVIDASKGNINVNKRHNYFMKCLGCLFSVGTNLSKKHTNK